jgi:hypothetical protein
MKMIRNLPKPNISLSFTVDDIHKIREWNYERLIDATVEERLQDIRRRAAAGRKRLKSSQQTAAVITSGNGRP